MGQFFYFFLVFGKNVFKFDKKQKIRLFLWTIRLSFGEHGGIEDALCHFERFHILPILQTVIWFSICDLMLDRYSITFVHFTGLFTFRTTYILFLLFNIPRSLTPTTLSLSIPPLILSPFRWPPVVFYLHCFLRMRPHIFWKVAFGSPLRLSDQRELLEIVEWWFVAVVSRSGV